MPGLGIYAERVLDLSRLDVEEIATALSDQIRSWASCR
jgi:hypothetical protein